MSEERELTVIAFVQTGRLHFRSSQTPTPPSISPLLPPFLVGNTAVDDYAPRATTRARNDPAFAPNHHFSTRTHQIRQFTPSNSLLPSRSPRNVGGHYAQRFRVQIRCFVKRPSHSTFVSPLPRYLLSSFVVVGNSGIALRSSGYSRSQHRRIDARSNRFQQQQFSINTPTPFHSPCALCIYSSASPTPFRRVKRRPESSHDEIIPKPQHSLDANIVSTDIPLHLDNLQQFLDQPKGDSSADFSSYLNRR